MEEREPKRRALGAERGDDHFITQLNLATPIGPMVEFGDMAGEEDEMETMTYDDLITVKYTDCFACQNINSASLRENEVYFNMMKLYTDNSTAICRDGIYKLIRDYFVLHVKPELDLADESEGGVRDWPLECIKEHFLKHTMYATDEILRQINITAGLRNHMMNHLVKVGAGTKVKYDLNYIKTLISLNQELRKLRAMKKELPNLVGYDHVLNF